MDMLDMATVIRGSQLRTHDMQWMIRWATAWIRSPHVKKQMEPEKMLKLHCDKVDEKKKGKVREKLEQYKNIEELWDSTPDDKWVKEVIK